MNRPPVECHRCGEPATIAIFGPSSQPLCDAHADIAGMTFAEIGERYPEAQIVNNPLTEHIQAEYRRWARGSPGRSC